MFQTSAKYFNFNEESSDEDGRCSIMSGKGDGKWVKTSCENTHNTKNEKITVLCQKEPGNK